MCYARPLMESLFGINFGSLPIWGNVLVFVAMVVIIARGASWFVDGAGGIGRRMGISELVLGLTIVAIGTSAPEFAVSITAALKGQGDISVSNVVGSNIFNLGIILGACVLFRPLPTSPTVVYRDTSVLFAGTLAAFLLVGLDLELGRFDGIFLLSGLVAYLLFLVHIGRRNKRSVSYEPVPEASDSLPKELLLFALGLALVLVSSRLLVDSATTVALELGVSQWVIGVTIVAAGTSAPELATSLAAAMKGRGELGVGALIGSDIFNLFGVMGVAGAIHPVSVAPASQVSLMTLSGMVLLVGILMRTGWRLTGREGVVLIVVALARWAMDIFGGGLSNP